MTGLMDLLKIVNPAITLAVYAAVHMVRRVRRAKVACALHAVNAYPFE